ncbi:MAG TPA: (5-formylfuran-3-yl)methyl phosphate synthase [Gemmataceae bacterium]|nr:(5-formylfuran-3-yl)methyl phosphate synthase [Gemmataceae bacterium]
MTQLLVSVRSAAEAEAALAGGAALIDVKEPSRGALGRADDAVIADVVRVTAGRAPVSAALGELADEPSAVLPASLSALSYVKCGLAGLAADGEPSWPSQLAGAADVVWKSNPLCKVAVVAYADWRRAQAPTPDEVCTFASRRPGWAFLLDTWGKDGLTLLDWMSRVEIDRLCRVCRDAGVKTALAGSLSRSLIRTLKPTAPDWFAVRGAVCGGSQRTAAVNADKVRGLVEALTESNRES